MLSVSILVMMITRPMPAFSASLKTRRVFTSMPLWALTLAPTLLALSIYKRYRDTGAGFVPDYLELLAAGGSRSPEELGEIVGVDLTDPGFWHAGLDLVLKVDGNRRTIALPPALADYRPAGASFADGVLRVRFDRSRDEPAAMTPDPR